MPQVEERKSGSTGRTVMREARCEQLINATIDSISRRDLSGTTLEIVTMGAKLSHGVVNFDFDSEEDLYIGTLGFLVDEHYACWHDAVLEAHPNAAAQLVAIVGADFDRKICTPKKLSVSFAFWGQAKHRPNYLKMRQRHDHEREIELRRLCEEIVASGCYDQLDAVSVARSIEALVDGLWLSMLLYPKEISREKARLDCLSYFAQVFTRHFARPEPDDPFTCSMVAG